MPINTVASAVQERRMGDDGRFSTKAGGQVFGIQGKDRLGKDNVNNGTKANSLYAALRPMFLTMKIFGMYSLSKPSGAKVHNKTAFGYSVIVLIIIWGVTIANTLVLQEARALDDIITRSNFITWFVYVSCHATAMFLMCARKGGWRRLFVVHEAAQGGMWPAEGVSVIGRRVYAYVVIIWSCTTSNIAFCTYLIFFTNIYETAMIFLPALPSFEMVVKAIIWVITVYMSAYWFVPIALSVLLNDLLATEFRLFNEKLDLEGNKCPIRLCAQLCQMRDMHQRLTTVADAVNGLVTGITAACMLFNLVIICLCLFSLIYNSLHAVDPLVFVSLWFWILTACASLFVTTGTCAWVNVQMNMFLAKLTGSYIGIYAGNIFVIDKNTVLTVVGMLITYFVVLIQFRPTTPSCDCSSWLANITVQCTSSASNLTSF